MQKFILRTHITETQEVRIEGGKMDIFPAEGSSEGEWLDAFGDKVSKDTSDLLDEIFSGEEAENYCDCEEDCEEMSCGCEEGTCQEEEEYNKLLKDVCEIIVKVLPTNNA